MSLTVLSRSLPRVRSLAGALSLALFAVACGSEATGGAGLVGAGPMGSADVPSKALVRITASGISPRAVRVRPGGQVTLLNDDGVAHELASSPHPSHGGCPELNVGVLDAGESITVVMPSPASCGFHDEEAPAVQALVEIVVPGSALPY